MGQTTHGFYTPFTWSWETPSQSICRVHRSHPHMRENTQLCVPCGPMPLLAASQHCRTLGLGSSIQSLAQQEQINFIIIRWWLATSSSGEVPNWCLRDFLKLQTLYKEPQPASPEWTPEFIMWRVIIIFNDVTRSSPGPWTLISHRQPPH